LTRDADHARDLADVVDAEREERAGEREVEVRFARKLRLARV
jgi:hypothetical protein